MKLNHLLSTLLAVGITLSSQASAGLLVGFSQFDNTSSPEAADVAATGFSGSVAKASASSAVGGSSDTFYGLDMAGPSTNDGHLWGSQGGFTIFSLTNSSGTTQAITNILFDAAKANSGSLAVSVAYRLNGGSWIGLTDGVLSTNQLTTRTAGVSYDYADMYANLTGVRLKTGETMQFRLNTTSTNLYLDNIAILGSPIPEPGSLVALSCLLGSGLFLRTRRRS